ncbi:UBX domain-containing protein 7 [Smittium mucronatum]|uniref:UBX domain-containing protein 7 n=1 Tax=Smittium mucronatum TaxID=133383 RepID=A0A1R0GVB4_9FUNG|nr:UBX domain-containing protein 7 [Smittium mucronatum]
MERIHELLQQLHANQLCIGQCGNIIRSAEEDGGESHKLEHSRPNQQVYGFVQWFIYQKRLEKRYCNDPAIAKRYIKLRVLWKRDGSYAIDVCDEAGVRSGGGYGQGVPVRLLYREVVSFAIKKRPFLFWLKTISTTAIYQMSVDQNITNALGITNRMTPCITTSITTNGLSDKASAKVCSDSDSYFFNDDTGITTRVHALFGATVSAIINNSTFKYSPDSVISLIKSYNVSAISSTTNILFPASPPTNGSLIIQEFNSHSIVSNIADLTNAKNRVAPATGSAPKSFPLTHFLALLAFLQFISLLAYIPFDSSEQPIIHKTLPEKSPNENLNAAVSFYLESDGKLLSNSRPSDSSSAGPDLASSRGNQDTVRAPIASRRDVLIDNSYSDFDRPHWNFSSDDQPRSLSELFRAPVDILFRGDFEAAKAYAVSREKWLLINIQAMDNFECQVLNRDLWKDKVVKDIIKKNFVFCQYISGTDSAEMFKRFYNANELPHISILDPRTVINFLYKNPWDHSGNPSTSSILDNSGLNHPSGSRSNNSNSHNNNDRNNPDIFFDITDDSDYFDSDSESDHNDTNFNTNYESDHNSLSDYGSDDLDSHIPTDNRSLGRPHIPLSTHSPTISHVYSDRPRIDIDDINNLSSSPEATDNSEIESISEREYIKKLSENTLNNSNPSFKNVISIDYPDQPISPTTTRIQFRFPDGKRVVKVFKKSDKVYSIFQFVKHSVPPESHDDIEVFYTALYLFILVEIKLIHFPLFLKVTFNRKKLWDDINTQIDKAGLCNSTIMVEY